MSVVHMLVSEKTDTHKTLVARVLDISLRILYSNVHYRLDYSTVHIRWKSLTNDHNLNEQDSPRYTTRYADQEEQFLR